MKNLTTEYKKLANNKQVTSYDIVCNSIMKAMNCKKNVPPHEIAEGILSRAFTEVTNENKLENGHQSFRDVKNAIHRIRNFSWFAPTWKSTDLVTSGKIFGYNISDVFETEEEMHRFKHIADNIDIKKLGQKYVIIYVAQNALTPEQQLVQASHAAFKVGNHAEFLTSDPIFWVIGVKVDTLDALQHYLLNKNVEFVSFTEPDVGGLITSIATFPMRLGKSHRYKTENLLKFN